MKKTVILVLSIILSLSGCGNKDIRNDISDSIKINVSSGRIVEESDSHGGVHGDGMLLQKLSFEDDKVLNEIKGNQNWKQFPVSRNVEAIVYGMKEETEETEDSVHICGPYLTGEDGEAIIPEIQNGYYYFYDRQSESEDPYNDEEVLNRASFNFILALYDSDHNVLYYVEFDT